MAGKRRLPLDALVVARGLAPDREAARARIQAQEISAHGVPLTNPASLVDPGIDLRLRSAPPAYVSRGGHKLAGALDAFGVDPRGRTCADLGASTGGFTDCLLKRGAARVYAIDVGYGQLAWSLRIDPRVVVMERTNAREVAGLEPPPELVVADLSFTSLRGMLGPIGRIAAPGAEAVLLVKPQFEVGPDALLPGGRVVDDSHRELGILEVLQAVESVGLAVLGRAPSPLPGARAGNVEELIHLRLPAPP